MDTLGILDDNIVEIDLVRLILENFEDGIYLIDRNRRILYWSEGAERITGHLAHEVIGKTCNVNLLSHCGEQGTPYCADGCPLSATMEEVKSRRMRCFIRHKNGHRVPINSRSAPVKNRAGELIGAVEIIRLDVHHYGLAQRFRGLEPFGCLDPETGVANKQMTELRMAHRLEDLRKFGIPVGIAGIKIEDQAPMVSRFGKEAWFSLLRASAQTLAQTLPPNGFVGRWDENWFLALIGNCDPMMLQNTASLAANLVAASEISWWGAIVRPKATVRTTMGEITDAPLDIIQRLLV
jgi:PAS domain S-box-containing protein